MNITRENTGDLTATVKIEISKQDYDEKVNKALKDYQRKSNIPGFRPGHVPFGMIKKMYGKAILADEVNHLLSTTLMDYIRDEKLDVLGNPVANEEKTPDVNFDTQTDFEFYFDLGLAPVIDLNLGEIQGITRYKIAVDDKMIDQYVTDMRTRYGNETHPEESGQNDMIRGELQEVNEDGTAVEGGIKKTSMISLQSFSGEESKVPFTGLTKEAKVRIKPLDMFADAFEASKVLGLTTDQVEKPGLLLDFTVSDIYHIEPAELKEEFFGKVFPGEEIASEEDFRQRVKKDAETGFESETDKLFYRHVTDHLVKEVNVPLPDQFLKRWLRDQKENRMSAEEVDSQYDMFAESMKWQLIENKLIRENEIKVSEEDIRAYIKNYFLRQIPLNIQDAEAESRYDSLVDTVMKNEEQVRKINDELYSAKLLDLLKEKVNTEEKEVSYDEFIKFVSELKAHDHDHDHEHHDHEHHHDHDHEHDHDHDHNH
ncbi:MAG: trigger factor [Syntrophothermus sp.]